MVRMTSPSPGSSILMTSAPSSPSSPAQKGAEIRVPTSITRRPESGPAAPAPSTSAAGRRVASVPLGQNFFERALLLAFLEGAQRRLCVVGEVVSHEVVLPRIGLAHQIGGVVDGVLYEL